MVMTKALLTVPVRPLFFVSMETGFSHPNNKKNALHFFNSFLCVPHIIRYVGTEMCVRMVRKKKIERAKGGYETTGLSKNIRRTKHVVESKRLKG